jgi:hypothetical protein
MGNVCIHRMASRDDAVESKFKFTHTAEVRLLKSNLACLSVKKFNPIILAAEVGNLLTRNE